MPSKPCPSLVMLWKKWAAQTPSSLTICAAPDRMFGDAGHWISFSANSEILDTHPAARDSVGGVSCETFLPTEGTPMCPSRFLPAAALLVAAVGLTASAADLKKID